MNKPSAYPMLTCSCGGLPELVIWQSEGKWRFQLCKVTCTRCGYTTDETANERHAVSSWNTKQERDVNEPPVCGVSDKMLWPQWVAVVVVMVAAIIGAVVAILARAK